MKDLIEKRFAWQRLLGNISLDEEFFAEYYINFLFLLDHFEEENEDIINLFISLAQELWSDPISEHEKIFDSIIRIRKSIYPYISLIEQEFYNAESRYKEEKLKEFLEEDLKRKEFDEKMIENLIKMQFSAVKENFREYLTEKKMTALYIEYDDAFRKELYKTPNDVKPLKELFVDDERYSRFIDEIQNPKYPIRHNEAESRYFWDGKKTLLVCFAHTLYSNFWLKTDSYTENPQSLRRSFNNFFNISTGETIWKSGSWDTYLDDGLFSRFTKVLS